MKYLVVLFFLLQLLTLGCTPKTELEKPAEKEVLVKPSPYNSIGSDRLETNYEVEEENCKIAWQIISLSKDKKIEAHLIHRTVCDRNFDAIIFLHNRVLSRLLKDYPAAVIKSLATGGLKSIQQDGSWNDIVANAASVSKDYLDYRKNYPNHKSKKSINDIFVDLVLQTQPHAPFKKMLASHGLKFELAGVEKVFNSKMSSGETLIDDAGMFSWKLTTH